MRSAWDRDSKGDRKGVLDEKRAEIENQTDDHHHSHLDSEKLEGIDSQFGCLNPTKALRSMGLSKA